MVTTINEFLFPILLFVCYYCTVSVAIYHQQSPFKATAEKSAIFPNIQVIFDEEEALFDENLMRESTEEVSPIAEKSHSFVEQDCTKVKQNKTLTSGQQNSLYTEAEAIIKNLNKRQSRQLCKPLGIQQKCGKVEKSLIFIKAEIRSVLKDDPERVIAVIQEKFSDLISTASQASFVKEKIAS
jgi:hypothetical protein